MIPRLRNQRRAYNANELRFLDDYEQPRCYVMYVMTNLRHHYLNSYRMTTNEDISNPFDVTYFSVSIAPIWTLFQNVTHIHTHTHVLTCSLIKQIDIC